MWTKECVFAELKRQVRHSQRSAYSDGTFKNFKTQLKSYLLFCEYFHIESVPVSVETLCLYIQFLGRSMKINTVDQKLLEWSKTLPPFE